MTGWTRGSSKAHQREKIYCIIRESPKTVYEITGLCWKSSDPVINKIKPPTIRRCLQELRDHIPQMAAKDEISEKWIGLKIGL